MISSPSVHVKSAALLSCIAIVRALVVSFVCDYGHVLLVHCKACDVGKLGSLLDLHSLSLVRLHALQRGVHLLGHDHGE